ncbi:MAG: hypothetical protein KF782_34760 [Labilithrix sp.]|nr:hypothetical protein [Labilithrix sp.]
MSNAAIVVSVDVDGVVLERAIDRTQHHVSWAMMRQAGAPLTPRGSVLGEDDPVDVAIHDVYAPLLAEARRMADAAGLRRRVVWEDIGAEVMDPDRAREYDESRARQRALSAEIDALAEALGERAKGG